MLRVGLTGSIGAGKSTVAKIFESLNIPVYYADVETKLLYDSDETLKHSLIEIFGAEIYSGGTFDRKLVAEKAFRDQALLEQLNALVHPAAIASAERWMKNQSAPYVIKEAALIFESGSATTVDLVIGVTAPRHLRLLRAMKRDNLTREQVIDRESKQISDSIKMKLCDFVITNDEQTPLIPQVMEVHGRLANRQ